MAVVHRGEDYLHTPLDGRCTPGTCSKFLWRTFKKWLSKSSVRFTSEAVRRTCIPVLNGGVCLKIGWASNGGAIGNDYTGKIYFFRICILGFLEDTKCLNIT